MLTPKRANRPLALIGWLGILAVTGLPANLAQAAVLPERILPESTVFLLKLNDAKSFREAFLSSQYGQLWNDPALKDFRVELAEKLDDATKGLKERIGISFKELIELPQGPLTIAAIATEPAPGDAKSKDANKPGIAGVLLAEMGENQKKMLDVLDNTSKQAERDGAKVSTESFNGLTLHIVQLPTPKEEPKAEGDPKEKVQPAPPPPLVWTNTDSLFYIATDIDVLKDLTSHREGRDNSLAASESFVKTGAKTDSSRAQVVWYLDVNRLVKAVIKSMSKGGEAEAQQSDVLVQTLGVYGLKSVGGSFTLGAGSYDSLSKTFFHAPKPVQGLLKVFSMPLLTLRPESWVPATVASYQTMSLDLDNAYLALEEVINKFQQGGINLVEQQLAGPEGGEPLSFQKDLFGPLGDRITVISDFKKPIKEDSQRMLLAVSLEDTKAFQNTLSRLFAITGAAPEKREFQGTTIYDFAVNLPEGAGAALKPEGLGKNTISLAVAKDTLFVTSDTTLLEQVLRPGNATLAESASFQSIAKEYPEKASGLSYVRPDESARLSYDLIKSGRFEKAILQGMAARGAGANMPNIGKLIPVDKLPDFSVFAKYLSLGGGFGVMDDDGFTMTGFSLRKSRP
jgi:hypothetical protein